jgi:sensor histidine kinase YesM
LNHSGLIPFRQELEHVRIYTEIEMLMFPYIQIRYDIEDDCFSLPMLTVQPLVENAIRHGVRARSVGQIDITVRKNETGHTITIADNGLGFDPSAIDTADEKHIGIRNVRERLEKQCGGSLHVESRQGEGTVVTLFIPLASQYNEESEQEGAVR